MVEPVSIEVHDVDLVGLISLLVLLNLHVFKHQGEVADLADQIVTSRVIHEKIRVVLENSESLKNPFEVRRLRRELDELSAKKLVDLLCWCGIAEDYTLPLYILVIINLNPSNRGLILRALHNY